MASRANDIPLDLLLGQAESAGRASRALGLGGNAVRRRGVRVGLLLILLWILNAFDLTFTIMAHELGNFNELNPIARELLEHPYLVVLFKLALVGFATVVMWTYRHRWLVELSCWAVSLVYIGLSLVWLRYFHRVDQHMAVFWLP